jgi:probable HAF family extracellular repeat protein
MHDLGGLGGYVGFAAGLNNRGQVIGGSSLAVDPGACYIAAINSLEFGNPNCHAFLWTQGKLIDLTTSTSRGSPITAFSNAPFDAYMWRNGVATDLGHLADCFRKAFAINSHGHVAAGTFSCIDGSHSRAFLWENGTSVDLNTLIPPGSSLTLVWAMAINDREEIAGIGVPAGCSDLTLCGHAFLLISCRESDQANDDCEDRAELTTATPRANLASITRSPSTLDDGHVNAFNPSTGAFLGTMKNQKGQPITNPGLWGLVFGAGNIVNGDKNHLFFAAGPDN